MPQVQILVSVNAVGSLTQANTSQILVRSNKVFEQMIKQLLLSTRAIQRRYSSTVDPMRRPSPPTGPAAAELEPQQCNQAQHVALSAKVLHKCSASTNMCEPKQLLNSFTKRLIARCRLSARSPVLQRIDGSCVSCHRPRRLLNAFLQNDPDHHGLMSAFVHRNARY